MEQSRNNYNNNNNNNKEYKSLLFLFSSRNFALMLFALMSCIILFSLFCSTNGNLIVLNTPEKNTANAQVKSTENSNIIDLKVSERNNNYVWTSDNSKVNPQLDLKLGKEYIFQIESMTDNNTPHQLIIQDEHGKQLAKSTIVSNGNTDDFPFKFTKSGNYQYHCQYHPSSMHGNIVVS